MYDETGSSHHSLGGESQLVFSFQPVALADNYLKASVKVDGDGRLGLCSHLRSLLLGE